MRYNYGVYCVIYQMEGATNLTPEGYAGFNINTFQNANSQPFYVTGSVTKNMSSEPQFCSLSFSNPKSVDGTNIIEQWLNDYVTRSIDFLDNDYRLEVFAGYNEDGAENFHSIFIGDITAIDIPPAPTVNDMAFNLIALGGNREMNRPRVRNVFPAETSDLEIVEFIYNVWLEEWGTLRGVIADPDAKLATTLRKRPYTIDKNETDALDDIADRLDYVWGIDRNYFFCVPKNYLGDVVDDDKAIYDVDTQTGKVGLSGLQKGRIVFDHLTDENIQLGRGYRSSDVPAMNVPPIELRADNINYVIDNMAPQPCRISGFILDGNKSKLPIKQFRIDKGMMR